MSKSLQEQLRANDEAFARTGHLFGLETLENKERDPGTYEGMWHVLSNMCNIAWETGCKVSSSPIAVEGGDALWALNLPTGEAVCVSRGITAHVSLLADMVRSFIELGYEDYPGFKQGDIFENNDPHFGGIHSPDFDSAMPIFYGDTLVAWATAVSHVSDCGSVTPGSVGFLNPDCYSDGLCISMEKVGENDSFYPWYDMRIRSRTRTPDFVLGDARGRLAGCVTIRERVTAVIDKYGLDFFMAATREYVEDSRRYAVGRVASQTVPGRARKSQFKDLAMKDKHTILGKQDVDCLFNLPMEVEIKADASVNFSLRGASGTVPFGENISPMALRSGLLNGYSHLIGFDMFNSGPASAWTVETPPDGSWANPFEKDYSASSGVAWAPSVIWMSNLYEMFGRLFQMRGFVEEMAAGAATTMTAEFAGITQLGYYLAGLTLEQASNGSPARGLWRRREQRLVHLHAQRRLRQRRGHRALLPDPVPRPERRTRLGWLRPLPRWPRAHGRLDGAQHPVGDRLPVRRRRHALPDGGEPRHVRRLPDLDRHAELRARDERQGARRGTPAARARAGAGRATPHLRQHLGRRARDRG
ncbi:MAG: hydantoinase B/oxoprolinase family protein [Acidimicrobiia bacterium]|nr:hydantoinase B/oxoprolinase family protein [Acidimicrobiia bacterium]